MNDPIVWQIHNSSTIIIDFSFFPLSIHISFNLWPKNYKLVGKTKNSENKKYFRFFCQFWIKKSVWNSPKSVRMIAKFRTKKSFSSQIRASKSSIPNQKLFYCLGPSCRSQKIPLPAGAIAALASEAAFVWKWTTKGAVQSEKSKILIFFVWCKSLCCGLMNNFKYRQSRTYSTAN